MTSEYEKRGFAPVVSERFNTIVADQIAGTGAAAQLPDHSCYELILQADPNNGNDILLGDDTTQPFVMQAGFSFILTIDNSNLLYANIAVGDNLNLIVLREE